MSAALKPQTWPEATIATAILVTETELDLVRQLIQIRGDDPRLITDELEVLARLADLHVQAGQSERMEKTNAT